MVGTGLAAQHGVLIKGADVLETANKISAVMFDKTGTLTLGKPVVTGTVLPTPAPLGGEEWLFAIAGAAESGSEHPIGRAIVNHATDMLGLTLATPEDVKAVGGKGIGCTVSGQQVLIGNRQYLEENAVPYTTRVSEKMEELEQGGNTVVMMAVDGVLVGCIAIADKLKDEAALTVHGLMKRSIQVFMVTGDNERTAHAIAAQVGIAPDNVFAQVLPKNKAERVRELQARGMQVVMVGDGINDSPALAQADLGIAIGAGTDVAMEAADVVLMRSNLWDVVKAISISRKTYWRIRINFLWAFLYNTIGIPIAAGILYPALRIGLPPALAAAAMALSSVSVVLSALHLRLYRPPRAPQARPSSKQDAALKDVVVV